MYTPLVRLLLGVGGLALAYFYYNRGSMIAYNITLVSVSLVVWGYFRNGTVPLAWKKVSKQEFDKAENILLQTKFPQYLKNQHKGFYHFSWGLIKVNKADLSEAHEHLLRALAYGVQTENNTAIVNLNLSEIELEKGNLNQAKSHIQALRSLHYNQALEPGIIEVENRINNAEQVRYTDN